MLPSTSMLEDEQEGIVRFVFPRVFSERTRKELYCKGSQTLEQVVQRGFGIAIMR